MKLEEACRLLDIRPGDSERVIRAKYHQAVRRFHPDAAALDEEKALAMTKKLNAAFALVMKDLRRGGSSLCTGNSGCSSKGTAGQSAGEDRTQDNAGRKSQWQNTREDSGWADTAWTAWTDDADVWPASQNPAAFCDRTIYAVGDLFSSMGWFPEEDVNDPDDFYESSYMTSPRPVASGKYLWDPDYESFPLFLYSLHQKCRALLQEEVIDPMLLHYLALEFIRPWDCLRKIVDDYPGIHAEETDGQTRYRFEAGIHAGQKAHAAVQLDQKAQMHAAGKSGQMHPAAQTEQHSTTMDVLTPVIRRERIHLLLLSGEDLGYLSFEEDPLYYICLMILRAGSGELQIRIKDAARSGRLRLEVILASDRSGQRRDQPENHNLEIARLLAEHQG